LMNQAPTTRQEGTQALLLPFYIVVQVDSRRESAG
jgi:hypothetical protein